MNYRVLKENTIRVSPACIITSKNFAQHFRGYSKVELDVDKSNNLLIIKPTRDRARAVSLGIGKRMIGTGSPSLKNLVGKHIRSGIFKAQYKDGKIIANLN